MSKYYLITDKEYVFDKDEYDSKQEAIALAIKLYEEGHKVDVYERQSEESALVWSWYEHAKTSSYPPLDQQLLALVDQVCAKLDSDCTREFEKFVEELKFASEVRELLRQTFPHGELEPKEVIRKIRELMYKHSKFKKGDKVNTPYGAGTVLGYDTRMKLYSVQIPNLPEYQTGRLCFERELELISDEDIEENL